MNCFRLTLYVCWFLLDVDYHKNQVNGQFKVPAQPTEWRERKKHKTEWKKTN